MKIILTSFKELITVKELIDVINGQLKALNLNQAGVNIYFKQYPTTETSEDLDIPEELITSGLNTVVFDTKMNTITVYISGQSDVIEELKTSVKENADKTTEISEKLDVVENSVTTAAENITLLTSSISTINETLESMENEIKTLKEKVETLEGRE